MTLECYTDSTFQGRKELSKVAGERLPAKPSTGPSPWRCPRAFCSRGKNRPAQRARPRRDCPPYSKPSLRLPARALPIPPPHAAARPICALSAGAAHKKSWYGTLIIDLKLVQRYRAALAPPACYHAALSARSAVPSPALRSAPIWRLTLDASQDRSRDHLGATQPSRARSSPTPRDARASARLVNADGCSEERGRSATRLMA